MAEGPVVSNTGPIIALASVSRLDLLAGLFGSVTIPEAVFGELAAAGPGRPGATDLTGVTWVERVRVDPPPERLLADELGAGEAEAITLAIRRGARLLLLDDRRARRIAEVAYGLRVKGAAGLLVAGKRRGLVVAVRPVLEDMRARGYYLSHRLVERACREAGE